MSAPFINGRPDWKFATQSKVIAALENCCATGTNAYTWPLHDRYNAARFLVVRVIGPVQDETRIRFSLHPGDDYPGIRQVAEKPVSTGRYNAPARTVTVA